MRSKISERILSETSQETKDKVKNYADKLVSTDLKNVPKNKDGEIMKRTDKEIIEAMTFIKEQHNGELPYQFGTFECAKMMAKYLKEQFAIHNVVGR